MTTTERERPGIRGSCGYASRCLSPTQSHSRIRFEPLEDDGRGSHEGPVDASRLGLSHFFAAAARHVRPYWTGTAVVALAGVPQVALETAQPMLLMVLIDGIVGRDMSLVWAASLGLVALIPIYVAGNFV